MLCSTNKRDKMISWSKGWHSFLYKGVHQENEAFVLLLFKSPVILCHEKKGHAEWHPHPGLYITVYATGETWQFWPGSRDTDCGLVQSVSLQVNGAIHHVKLSDKAAANESIESFPRLFDCWIIMNRSVKSARASRASECTASSHLFTKLKSPRRGYTEIKA